MITKIGFASILCSMFVFASAQDQQQLPIQVARTISFDTDEGTNMSVDISPDESTIVFDLLGDLYTIPVSGGIAKQITRGMAINKYPVWSPDGGNIAYISDASGAEQLHVRSIDGKSDRIFGKNNIQAGLSPMWVFGGVALMETRIIYHMAGGEVKLADEELPNIVSISVDGRYTYYKDWDGLGIKQYDRTTGAKKQILVHDEGKQGPLNNIQTSPDGHWLTYITGSWKESMDSLMLCDLKTGNIRLLAALNIKYPGMALLMQHYSFSTNSKTLYIGYGGKIHQIDIATGDNRIIPFTAHVNVDMGELNYNTFKVSLDSLQVKYIRYPQLRPDGKQLVFSALNRLYVMNIPNGTPHILASQPFNQFHPCYSADGKWIAYVSWKDTEGGYVWRVPSTGGKSEQLTSLPGDYRHPSWKKDGSQLVVMKGTLSDYNYGNGQVQIISLSDRSAKIIADSVPLFNRPVFSPNGNQIVYKPNQSGGDRKNWPRLVSRNINTKNTKVLADGTRTWEYVFPMEGIIKSPDGRYITFSNNESVYLVPLINLEQPATLYNSSANLPVIRFAKSGLDPQWEENGRILSWSYADKYYRINPDKIISQAIKNAKYTDAPVAASGIVDVEVVPDETISMTLKVPSEYGKGVIAFKNVRIITMSKDEVIEEGTVIIKDGRFTAVGSVEKITIPKSAKVFDLKGKTIMPGLIDLHHHVAGLSDIIGQQQWKYLALLAYGVTTARDPAGSQMKFAYQELTQTGQMVGPRLFHVGGPVRPDKYDVTSLNEAQNIVQNRTKMGAAVVKQYTLNTRLERQRLLIACHNAGLNMTNEGDKLVFEQIGMLKDGSTGIEHSPNWGDTYKDVRMLFAKSGTTLTPTLQVSYSADREDRPMYYFRSKYLQNADVKYDCFTPAGTRKNSLSENRFAGFNVADIPLLKFSKNASVSPRFVKESEVVAAIRKQGGKITLGSHGEDHGIGVHFELWALQMGGLTNLEALQAATIMGAEALGIQKDVGSIEIGKVADLVVLNKNPLEDIHNSREIKYVMKSGLLYDGGTLNTIWPHFRKLPEWKLRNQ